MGSSGQYLTLRKYTDEQIALAKSLYMAYKTRKEIAEASGINIKTLPDYIEKWHPERELNKKEIFSSLADAKKRHFVDLANNGLEVLVRGVRELNRSGSPLSPRDLKEVAAVIEVIDKIIRLDDGKPTEITENIKPATRESIIELLKADPFGELEDAEYREKKEEENPDA